MTDKFCKKYILSLTTVLCSIVSPIMSQDIRYTTQWFGVNANPVPSLQGALIADSPNISNNIFFTTNPEDKTESIYLDVEIPIISQAVSLRVYGCLLEHYTVSSYLGQQRGMDMSKLSGIEGGDYYIQTRIRLLSENRHWRPNMILHSTLKTASADKVSTRRYFDTPGYFFHLEAGKELLTKTETSPLRLRVVLMLGFMCWETSGSLQNDAYMYGLQLIMSAKSFSLSSEISGYSGWMSNRYGPTYGDKPIVSRFALRYKLSERIQLTMGYEQGIRHFPHNQLHTGIKYIIPYNIKWN